MGFKKWLENIGVTITEDDNSPAAFGLVYMSSKDWKEYCKALGKQKRTYVTGEHKHIHIDSKNRQIEDDLDV